MIQIKRTGVVGDQAQLADLRQQFAEQKWVMLPNLLEPALLHYLLQHLAAARFIVKHEVDHHAGEEENEFGTTLFVPPTETALFLFHLLLNKPALFQLVQAISGCPPIGNFMGRIHRTVAGDSTHQIDWHDDIADHRLLGLNINLSTEAYEGGLFCLRERPTQQMLAEVGNLGLGNAFLFCISPDVEHCLTPVGGQGSRTVGVGWFRAQPDWPTFSKNFFPR